MRRTRFLVLLPALLALFGATRTATADTTALSVQVSCWNNGGGTYGCDAYVTGGTGTYVSYAWQVTDVLVGKPTYTYNSTTADQYKTGTCRVGASLTINVTVTDNLGESGTGTYSMRCRSYAD
jgi:hypothetical protein